MRHYWLAIFVILTASLSTTSNAQFEDLSGIIEDIIKGSQIPNQSSIDGETAIETITVTLHYNVPIPLDQHMITLSAYAPSDPAGKSKKAQLLGQTRLMMNGLSSPLKLGLPVPRAMQQNLSFIRITAEIRDENNARVMLNEREGLYRGNDLPELTLLSTLSAAQINEAPQISGLEIINGDVFIRDKTQVPRDGQLTVQLLENALAGSNTIAVAAEKMIQLDQTYPPYSFFLERGLVAGKVQTPLSLKSWITDWAGRKTHIIREPVAYNGAEIHYKLVLDALSQGANTARGQRLDPSLMAQTVIYGEAVFDPSNGIPSGAQLKATLSRSVGAFGENPTLTSQSTILHSQDTRIPFSLSTASTHFDPFIPAPILKLEIVDSRGNIFYDSGDIQAIEGRQVVQLYARRDF